MRARDKGKLRRILTNWLDELEGRADAALAELKNCQVESADEMEKACLEYGRNFSIRIHDRESRLIRRIRQSLQDIEDGTYGICQVCGEEIAIGRLMARPIANHCIDCKRRIENLEKAFASGTGEIFIGGCTPDRGSKDSEVSSRWQG
ncbi:MAG: TraR/DksA C4-type zinc finger protein [Desulfobacterales bacterium]